MSITLTSVARVNGATCNHFTVSYSRDGVSRTVLLDRARIENIYTAADSLFPGDYKDLLMALMLRYFFEKGIGLAALPAKCVLME